MKMTVKELIAHLSQLDENVEVQIRESGELRPEILDLDEHIVYEEQDHLLIIQA
ncbi:hypothetical protein RU97_GL001009 [Enterococcus canis]|uniref:Uncharacterized protein n=1 Tax=Enterococcus canis TaxID=214095 RepID=A0A1L8RI41_9ENTE|nr:hypothetical protein [Enterococcus canis]OJG19438.1 hypothetical protein RU97_GL001009 [Enterococcus canis]